MHRRLAAAAALLAVLAAGAVAADRIAPPALTRLQDLSLGLLDRQGTLLDVRLSRDGMWRLPAGVEDVDAGYLALLLRTEDARFERHPGVDPLALARAAWQLATRGRVVSGGSTLTMQTARLLTPHRHDVAGKLLDIARALQLEAHFTKPQILSMYLTLAPFGGNIEGVRAASLTWFGHEPSRLSQAEAALLVALPQGPARLRPDRHPGRAILAAGRVLSRAVAGRDAAELAPLERHALPREAGYLAVRLQGQERRGLVRTTLDGGLQAGLEALAARQLRDGSASGMAALVVRNSDRSVLAYLGGSNHAARGGQVDMVRARRSPGSALKPFIYGLAFDDGLVRPDTLIDDTAMRLGDYAPRDFDRRFHGTVSVGEALRQSYNLPAVQLLERVGPQRFVATLRQAGADVRIPSNSVAAGLPVALGGLGISLQDVAMLYAGLARDGMAAPLRLLAADPAVPPRALMTAASARQLGDILGGMARPDGRAPGGRAIAFKTGTSYGFRDAWAAGYSGRYTVVVWTGRVDGTPVPGAYGRNTAAPVLFQAFDLLPPEPAQEAGRVEASRAGRLSPGLMRFSPGRGERQGPRIVFPPDHATLELDGENDRSPLTLEAGSGVPPYRWLVDGVPLPRPDVGMAATWMPDGPGFAHLSVVDALNHEASVDIRLKRTEQTPPQAGAR
ncbi:MAG: penicillin-binding protein 1C [Janthinobacterium lividum]